MDLSKMKFKVQPVRKKSTKLLATGVLELGNMDEGEYGVRIQGFKIIRSKHPGVYRDEDNNSLWVAPPAYPDDAGGYKNIFFASPVMWHEIEKAFVAQYLRKADASA